MPNASQASSQPIEIPSLCVLCSQVPPYGVGEHVIPQWFCARYFPPEEGPFSTFRNGKPELTRVGTIRTQISLGREFLDVCEHCNKQLNTFFETRKERVAEFYDGKVCGDPESLCQWLVKTAILHNHPESWRRNAYGDRVKVTNRTRAPDQRTVDWLLGRAATAIPDWMTIWVARASRTIEEGSQKNIRQFDLPEFVLPGDEYKPTVSRLHIAGASDEILVDVVYHPGCIIEHPFDGHPTTARIFPNPPKSFSVEQLRQLDAQEYANWKSVWGWPRAVGLLPSFNPLQTPWRADILTDWDAPVHGTNSYRSSSPDDL